MSCGQNRKIDKEEITYNLVKPATVASDIETGYTLKTIPKNWGRIWISQADTFKVVECMTLSQIKIYDGRPNSYFKIESFYIGTDSLIIKTFTRTAPNRYEFNVQSINTDSSLTFALEITDLDKLMGDWILKDNGALLAMTMANTDKKKFMTTTYPCD